MSLIGLEYLQALSWPDYELIDCGSGLKFERFGKVKLIRPEPQALWAPVMEVGEWKKIAHAMYVPQTSNSGEWKLRANVPSTWAIRYQGLEEGNASLQFKLKFTSFKHVGIFPEQSVNWQYLYNFCKAIPRAKVLNLFAYTGGASLAAKAGGADVIHLDSVKAVVGWSRENMEASGLQGIRWTIEDAPKFVAREVKRGSKYNAIILDPPSYGIGPAGERWKLEEGIYNLISNCISLLDDNQGCIIVNTYSLNLPPLALYTLMEREMVKRKAKISFGELYTRSTTGLNLPQGIYLRAHYGVDLRN